MKSFSIIPTYLILIQSLQEEMHTKADQFIKENYRTWSALDQVLLYSFLSNSEYPYHTEILKFWSAYCYCQSCDGLKFNKTLIKIPVYFIHDFFKSLWFFACNFTLYILTVKFKFIICMEIKSTYGVSVPINLFIYLLESTRQKTAISMV